MTWNLKCLVTIFCVTFINYVWANSHTNFGKHHLIPIEPPKGPVKFPFEMHCVTNNVWRYILQEETRVCCCEAHAQCKKMRYQRTYLNCVTRNHEERNKMIKCCEQGNAWEKGHLTSWVEDC